MLERLSDKEIMQEYVLKDMIRYNNRIRIDDESVAEHTCFVSIFCLKIMSQLNLDAETERQVLILATLHDVAESETSDIPYNVKVNYPEIDEILDKIEAKYYKSKWNKYFDIVCKPSELAYNILKLADAYSVYQYCLNEINLGNKSDDVFGIIKGAQERIEERLTNINKILEEQNEFTRRL